MTTESGLPMYKNDAVGTFLQKWRIRAVLPCIRGALLDIGCGDNKLCKAYHGFSVGLDVYKWNGVDIIGDACSDLPFHSAVFDTVSILGAFNHIPERELLLKSVRRVLKPDGRLLMTMIPPGLSKLWHKIREQGDRDQLIRGMKDGEVFGISESDLSEMLERAGFNLKVRKRFMFGVNTLAVAVKKI